MQGDTELVQSLKFALGFNPDLANALIETLEARLQEEWNAVIGGEPDFIDENEYRLANAIISLSQNEIIKITPSQLAHLQLLSGDESLQLEGLNYLNNYLPEQSNRIRSASMERLHSQNTSTAIDLFLQRNPPMTIEK